MLILTSESSAEFFILNAVLFFYLLMWESDFNSTINRITNSIISMKLRVCSLEDPPQRFTFRIGLQRTQLKFFITWLSSSWNMCSCVRAWSLQLCPTLCDPMDCSPSGSYLCGILQARILEWVALPSCRGSSWPSDWTCISYVSCICKQVLYY